MTLFQKDQSKVKYYYNLIFIWILFLIQNNERANKTNFQIENWRRESFYELGWISTGIEIFERLFFDLENVYDFLNIILKSLLSNDDQSQRSGIDIDFVLELIRSGALKTFQLRYKPEVYEKTIFLFILITSVSHK